MAAAPGVAEGEVLRQGHVQEVAEVGDGDGAVGPGTGTVDGVAGLDVGGVDRGDVVGEATVTVVGEVVAEGDEGSKGVGAAGRWGGRGG